MTTQTASFEQPHVPDSVHTSPRPASTQVNTAVAHPSRAACRVGDVGVDLLGVIPSVLSGVRRPEFTGHEGGGVHRNRVWREWQREHRLTLRPQFGRSRGAWTMGLELRF